MIRENFREFCMYPGSGPPPGSAEHMMMMMDGGCSMLPIDDKLSQSSTFIPPPFMEGSGIGGSDGFNGPDADNNDLEGGGGGPEALFSDDDDDEVVSPSGKSATAAIRPSPKASAATASVNLKTAPSKVSVKDELTDDDDDLPLAKVRLKEKPNSTKVELPASIAATFEKFLTTRSCSDFEAFLTDFRPCTSLTGDQEAYVHAQVIDVVRGSTTTTTNTILPESVGEDKCVQESLNHPIYVLFRLFSQNEEKSNKKCVQNLVAELYRRYPSAGCLLLYFLRVHAKVLSRKSTTSGSNAAVPFKASVYKSVCAWAMPDETVEKCLARDLDRLERERSCVFHWLLPDIWMEFKTHLINNGEVLRVVLATVDATNLRDLIYAVTQGKLQLLREDGVLECVRASFTTYETYEQFCLWRLIQAHDIPIGRLQDLLPELDEAGPEHAEALAGMLLLLKNEQPTAELIRLLLSREIKGRSDQFVTCVLR